MVMAELAVNPSQVRERVAAKMREREANSQLAKTSTSAEPSPSEPHATVGRPLGHIAALEARHAALAAPDARGAAAKQTAGKVAVPLAVKLSQFRERAAAEMREREANRPNEPQANPPGGFPISDLSTLMYQ